jgi:hypothetical protein
LASTTAVLDAVDQQYRATASLKVTIHKLQQVQQRCNPPEILLLHRRLDKKKIILFVFEKQPF